MKIYSKKGDKGKTSLIGGKIVDKHNLSVDAYGTIDELNSFIGLLKDYVEDKKLRMFYIISSLNFFLLDLYWPQLVIIIFQKR